ncbi:MAG: acetyltransferase, family [Clostridiales bacterium]|nr:acetyltransferase, family [Clostridiales bacterium]
MIDEREIRFIKGNDKQQDEFIDFINYVFNMDGQVSDFYRLLPKLYKREYHPCEYNYLALENDRIKAAVGSFPGEVIVCGNRLTYQGIGNVAVNPYSRSKGYMKELMNQAIEDMLVKNVDFSVLGGNRQRYSYFSYEKVGRKFSFWMDESNIKHEFGENKKTKFTFILVEENSKEILKAISELQINQSIYYTRDDKKLYDILKNWTSVDIYGIYEGNEFSGYLLSYDKNKVKEIILQKQEDLAEVVADFIKTIVKGGISIEIPDYQRYFVNVLSSFAERVSINDRANFAVFNYDRVIEAFLCLKAQTDILANGEITLTINGKKRKEKLLVSVKDNKVSVTPCDHDTDYEYTHKEAMSVLFENYSPLRCNLPLEVQSWLPLPIYIFPADEV